jgi:hypothetical protein
MPAPVKFIADAILDYVERAGRPVTLAEVAIQISGFSDPNANTVWCWETWDFLIWDGMTKDGCAALRHIVKTGRVGMQQSKLPLYLFHGQCLSDPNWVPIALIPASKANFQTATILVSVPEETLTQMENLIAKMGRQGGRRINHAN